jgi:hypothetical protein
MDTTGVVDDPEVPLVTALDDFRMVIRGNNNETDAMR